MITNTKQYQKKTSTKQANLYFITKQMGPVLKEIRTQIEIEQKWATSIERFENK